jgi:CHAD domain-containing protein
MAKPLKVKKVSPSDDGRAAAVRIMRTRLAEFYSHHLHPHQTPTPAQLHDLRISGKRLRYSAESLRVFYPDQLALLIDLLKRLQDVLGEMQDCETQRAVVETDLARRQRRQSNESEIAALQRLAEHYRQRHAILFPSFSNLWHGLTRKKFRASLKAMISRPIKPAPAIEEPLTGD